MLLVLRVCVYVWLHDEHFLRCEQRYSWPLRPRQEVRPDVRGALQEGATALSVGEAARLVGEGAADRAGRGNVNVGDGGVAFVLAAAAGTPGGPDTVRCKGLPAGVQGALCASGTSEMQVIEDRTAATRGAHG